MTLMQVLVLPTEGGRRFLFHSIIRFAENPITKIFKSFCRVALTCNHLLFCIVNRSNQIRNINVVKQFNVSNQKASRNCFSNLSCARSIILLDQDLGTGSGMQKNRRCYNLMSKIKLISCSSSVWIFEPRITDVNFFWIRWKLEKFVHKFASSNPTNPKQLTTRWWLNSANRFDEIFKKFSFDSFALM